MTTSLGGARSLQQDNLDLSVGHEPTLTLLGAQMRTFVLCAAIVCPTIALAQGLPAASAQDRIAELEQRVDLLETLMRDSVAVPIHGLDCSGGGFAEVKARSGYLPFIVSCLKIEPYLEGYRATIQIVNPYSRSFYGISGILRHGETYADAFNHRVTFVSTAGLEAGKALSIQVAITPAAAKDVRMILVEFSYNQSGS